MPASATVAISDLAIELKRQGKPVISLSVGEPDFSPPPEVMEAAHEALREGKVKYTALAGSHELRSAVCDDLLRRKGLKYEPSQVVCCCGAKQAILQAVLALCNPGGDVTAPTPRCDMSRTRPLDATGDEIIVPTPYWPSHLGTAQLLSAHGASREKTLHGVTAEDLAEHNGHAELVAWLQQSRHDQGKVSQRQLRLPFQSSNTKP